MKKGNYSYTKRSIYLVILKGMCTCHAKWVCILSCKRSFIPVILKGYQYFYDTKMGM